MYFCMVFDIEGFLFFFLPFFNKVGEFKST